MSAGPGIAPTVAFSLDLEDHRPDDGYAPVYRAATRRVLGLLERHGIRATVFTVGALARQDPRLVAAIAEAGHEIAYHSANHVPLALSDPATFEAETRADKAFIEDLVGRAVTGYRAPAFSLTRATLWAVERLPALGFGYSSSVLPAPGFRNGFRGAPTTPFHWPNGLLELPAPVARLGPLTLPYLGGAYFRYLPWPLVRRRLSADPPPGAPPPFRWTYCHPFDFSPGERLYRLPFTSWPVTLALWLNRGRSLERLERLVPYLSPDTFAARVQAGAFAGSPRFDPRAGPLRP